MLCSMGVFVAEVLQSSLSMEITMKTIKSILSNTFRAFELLSELFLKSVQGLVNELDSDNADSGTKTPRK